MHSPGSRSTLSTYSLQSQAIVCEYAWSSRVNASTVESVQLVMGGAEVVLKRRNGQSAASYCVGRSYEYVEVDRVELVIEVSVVDELVVVDVDEVPHANRALLKFRGQV